MNNRHNYVDDNSSAPVPYDPAAGHLPSGEFREVIPDWDAEEVHLRDYLGVVLRRKWLIVNVLLLTFVTTLILTLAQPKLYRASSTIEVMPFDQKVTKFEDVNSSDMRAWDFYETQVELLQSRELARRVVDRLLLNDDPVINQLLFSDEAPGLLTRLKGMVRDLILSFIPKDRQETAGTPVVDGNTLRQQRLIGFVHSNLQVTPSKMAMLIQVSFMSPDRRLSRYVVNGIAEEFLQWNMEKKMDSSDLARTFLMKQIDRTKITLEKAEEELNGFAQRAGIVSLDTRHNSVYRQLEDLNTALAVAEAELISRRAVYKQARKDGPSILPEVMDSNMIGNLKGQYAELRAEYERQSVTFRDDYPAVRALLNRMQSIAARISEEEQKIFSTMRNRYEAAQEKKTALEARVARQTQIAMDLNERTTQYKIMEREVETNKQIYQSLLERSREIESMAGISSSNFHIVDKAAMPLFPAKPNVRRNLLLAVTLGLMLGLGLTFFLEYITDNIANPDEISDRFRIPILGVLPLVKKNKQYLDKALDADPQAPFCEALRTACISLKLSGTGNKSKSFVVTSTRPAEGKTTLASNLALTFAAGGEKVVLVDGDFRRPRVHKIYGANGNGDHCPGLSSFLAGAPPKGLAHSNGHGNLHIIPAGPIPPNPVELLASQRFSKLVRHLEKRYDRVIIDGPPMQGFADILVLSRNVGGVVLLCSVGETTRESLRQFKKSMANVNSTILGCIINKVDITKRYGYQSYHKYYGYYSYGDDKGKAKLLT